MESEHESEVVSQFEEPRMKHQDLEKAKDLAF